jgi:hypothetical protein
LLARGRAVNGRRPPRLVAYRDRKVRVSGCRASGGVEPGESGTRIFFSFEASGARGERILFDDSGRGCLSFYFGRSRSLSFYFHVFILRKGYKIKDGILEK